MKAKELRELTDQELVKRIEEESATLQENTFQHALKQLTNTAKLDQSKKDIARMYTILSERKIAAEKAAKQKGEGA